MKQFITAAEAAKLIKDGDVVASAGFGAMGICESVIEATEQRFLEEGSPKDLTLFYASHQGDNPIRRWGFDHWAHEGMIKRWIGSLLGSSPKLVELCNSNKMETYCLPLGIMTQMYGEFAAKRPGLLTKIGMNTFIDPRLEGGKMNSCTTEDIVELVNFKGEDWLFYNCPKFTVGLIRGTTVDTHGNLTVSEESVNTEALALAAAVKNNGGIVIAQAKYQADANTLNPREVHIPGVLIDYVVINENPDTHWQNEVYQYHPGLSGQTKVPLDAIPAVPLAENKIIARRAAMELRKGYNVNLGVGIPQVVASVAAEEKVNTEFVLSSEAGTVGGVALSGKAFGNAWNVECFLDSNEQMVWYNGGGLDITCLGLAETDVKGNVNVSKFGTRANGPGGLIDIAQPTKTVVFCGTFMAGKLITEIKDGKLVIVQEGAKRKFSKQVQQVTFSGEYAAQSGQKVLYVTERAVFKLTAEGMTLIEIAPGVDLEKDILANMDFTPIVSPDLKLMPEEIFHETWGGLKAIMDAAE